MFLGDLALLPDVGALLWPRLAGAYIQQCLAPLLPSGNSDMAAFDQVSCSIVTYSTVVLPIVFESSRVQALASELGFSK